MPEFVRVKDKQTKHEKSIPVSKFDPEVWTEVDKPAVKSDGTPLPDKPYKSLSSNPKASQKAATSEKEK